MGYHPLKLQYLANQAGVATIAITAFFTLLTVSFAAESAASSPAPTAMPRDYPGPRPKPRTAEEVNAALSGAPKSAEKTRSLQLLLVAGPKDHDKGEHDYPAWQKAWAPLLATAKEVKVDTAWQWPKPEQFQQADVIIFYQHGDWNEKRAADIDAFLKRGGGLVYIHWAVNGGKNGEDFAKRIGLSEAHPIGYRHGPLDIKFNTQLNHPIARNFDRLKLIDESYWKLSGNLPPNRVLGTSEEEGQPQPLLWTTEPSNGRVFVSVPGHYSWTFDDPLFRIVLLRGIAWAAHEPVDRFNDIVWLGADR